MAYPEQTWLKIRLDYEHGRVGSIKELAKKYNISEPAINKRLYKEHWGKSQHLPATSESIQQRFAQALEKSIGIDYLVTKVKELLDATDAIIIDGRKFGEAKNWTAIASGLKEANKILGTYAPVKTEIDINVKIKAVIAQVVPIIQEYVPENKRNECAQRLGAIT